MSPQAFIGPASKFLGKVRHLGGVLQHDQYGAPNPLAASWTGAPWSPGPGACPGLHVDPCHAAQLPKGQNYKAADRSGTGLPVGEAGHVGVACSDQMILPAGR
jgi:hypothetical protein